MWCIRFICTCFLLRWPHFLSKIVFKDVDFANCSCLLFLLLIVARLDYSHYVKISWYSRSIIVNVSWQNYFLTSMVDYMNPHISRCGHTLGISTFILVNLISYRKDLQTVNSHFNLKVIWKIKQSTSFLAIEENATMWL